MRILIISNCPLDPNQGSGYVICGYAERMSARGHKVVSYGPENFKLFPSWTRLNRLRLLLGYTYKALREVLREKYDIVELWGAPGWLATLFFKLLPIPRPVLVSRSNGLETHNRDIERLGHPVTDMQVLSKSPFSLADIAFRYCDALTLVSRYDEVYTQTKRYQKEDKLLVLENPLNDEWLAQNVAYFREPIIGFVGSWIKRKGADIIPEVIRLVLAQHQTARFLLIGVGNIGAQEINNVSEASRVELIPFCPRVLILEKYHGMAILLVPSIYESFGLVTTEAMACGVALVATPVGFSAGLKESEYKVIKKRTPIEVAKAIIELLENESKRQGMAKKGYQRVQSLRWENAVDQLERFYEKLLQRQEMKPGRLG